MIRKLEKPFCFLLVIFAAACMLVCYLSGCDTSKQVCTKHNQKKAARKFYKGLNACPSEVAKQSLAAFPFKQRDTIMGIQFMPGETITKTDTLVQYDTATKTVYKTIYIDRQRVDTVYADKVSFQADPREVMVRDAEIKQMQLDKEENDKKLAALAESGKIKSIILFSLLGVIVLYFAVKFALMKYSAAKALKQAL